MLTIETTDKEHPLMGAVICFTSVSPEQRTRLADFAREMGAIEQPDLTSDVTHLLVGATDSPKYKFVARERNDVLVLKPEWIEAVRESWMQGEDTDTRELEEKYKFPAFFDLTICITGFSDMAFRTQMHDLAVANGAEFRKDLTKSVTHLVARNAEGEKYKFATQWNIKVVTVKWFHDCIERGMILDEEKYHPMLPLSEQGVGAWNMSLPATKERAKERTGDDDGSLNPRPRKKLRRTASTKLVGQNENIWGDIIGMGFTNTESTGSKHDQWKENDLEKPKPPVIQAAKSFASESTFSETMQNLQQPETISKSDGFLAGSYFFIHGFSPKQIGVLRDHLGYNGAQCVNSMNEFSSPSIPKTGQGLYMIVPYRTPRSEIPSTDDLAFECEVVTDMWLERCLDTKALVPPESHVASTPFPKFPLLGFPGMRICSTGFARIDLLHLSKLVNLMGATYEEYLTPKASVLICNDTQTASRDKLRHTSEWGVPAVSADWFWISIQSGHKKPFEPYLIRRQASQHPSSVEKPGDGFTRENRRNCSSDQERDGKSNTSAESTNKTRIAERISDKRDKSRILPIMDDGFAKDETEAPPKPTVPESRSGSPSRTTDQPQSGEAPANNPDQDKAVSAAGPSALDTALKGLLQQAQAAKTRQQSDSSTNADDGSYPARRKRKPLLGRATSHSSSRKLETTRTVSRASSVDTLNDDGLGSVVESGDPTRENSLSRTNSRVEPNLSSIFSGGKFDFMVEKTLAPADNEDEENQEPQMTQLDYEDPDAAAMRAEFLRDAGKLTGKAKKPDHVALGEIRELEDTGWGSGRRTRKQPVKEDD
ncbi:hypothetical protein N7532_005674 [Penicillium argentinense]|uniref:BRCT domain-containing protein n=1 Tax=Penicillium argentinense TaxID=1131581 RepID=A0A9W9FEA9_9EURO|nr:uncharacterized protein N7532_005674 [Penicillium argentinense]KAJ5098673.1 hypothetical protein N7532_005674 [Penicillium argentinense]